MDDRADDPPEAEVWLTRFRHQLEKKRVEVPKEAFIELERQTADCVRLYLGKPNRMRPSAMARELNAMAKGLARAAKAAEAIGEDGMLRILLAFNAQSVPDYPDWRADVDYLKRMAMWTKRAAETSAGMAKSARDDEGGRPADYNLRSLVYRLMLLFESMLAISPLHTVDKETGLGVSLFDLFVKEAIKSFAPIEDRKIDTLIAQAIKGRDIEYWQPPDDFFSD